ncbi:hypothetical protein I7I51_01014 [Histoplasma capsulatum]|uniref:Uncharacterized protein n=1 Tax=Ajellomyces capsulatus TaxID=5037 RepID=A0A8A1MH11_AJECA|nr:hypothetical protein I7I51_01014 [Histoplasma capsulatum]
MYGVNTPTISSIFYRQMNGMYIPGKDMYMTRRLPFDILPSLAGSAKEMAVRGRQPPILLQVTTTQVIKARTWWSCLRFPKFCWYMYSTYTVQATFSDLKRIILFCFIRLWPVLSTDYPSLAVADGGRWKKSSHNRSWNDQGTSMCGRGHKRQFNSFFVSINQHRSSPQISINPLLQDVCGSQAEIDDLKVRLRNAEGDD